MEYRNGLGADSDLKTLTLAEKFKIASAKVVANYESFAEAGLVNYDFNKFLNLESKYYSFGVYVQNINNWQSPHTADWVWVKKLGEKVDWTTFGSLDNIELYQREISTQRNIFKTYAGIRKVGIHPAQYFYNLDIESDPVMYLRKLACWKSAGLCLNPDHTRYNTTGNQRDHLKKNVDHAVVAEKFYLHKNPEKITISNWRTLKPAARASNLPNTQRDSAIYGAYILRFAEKLTLTALGNALDYRQYAEIDDEYTLRTAQQVLIDSQSGIRSAIEETFTIKIYKEDKTLWGYVTSGIPDFGSVTLPGIGNFTFKKALIVLWEQYYLPLIESSLNIIGARLLELKNPKATIQPTAFTQSKRNPFMVFNPDASEKAGAPIFTNVSNQTAKYNLPHRNVLIGTASQLPYYMNAPDDRLKKIRNVIVAGGGGLSKNDIDNILGSDTGKDNSLLWVGAAVAGAASLVAMR